MKKISLLLLPVCIIVLIVLAMTGRYIRYGAPHEFITVEYKGTFEGDYDFTMELVESLKNLKIIPLWSQIYSGPIFIFAGNLHVLGQALLYFLTHNQALSVKLYQVIYFILVGIGMFLLANYIYKKRFVALFCSILYMFTPFFIGEMLAYLHYSATYFCLPFAYFFIFKALDSKEYIFYTLISALFIVFNLLSHPQNIFIAGIFYLFFGLGILLFCLFKILSKKDKQVFRFEFIKAIKIFSIICITVILLSLFFLLPTSIDGYPYTRSLTEGGTWLEPLGKTPGEHSRGHSQSLLSAITLWHWSWFITPLKNKMYPPLIFMIIYSLPFLLAIWGLFRGIENQNKPRILLFLFLGIISLNFSLDTGLHEFGLFNLAYRFIPYFHMARAPYRYFYQGVLSVCLLSGLILLRLSRRKSIILSLMVAIVYLYAANYYGNHYNWTFIPSEEPLYISQVQNWLKTNNRERHRIIETFGTPSYLGNNQRMFPNGLDLLLKRLNEDYLDKYLALFGVKYILSPRLHSKRHLTFDSPGYMPPRADDGYEDLEDAEEYYSALTTEHLFVYERLKDEPNFNLYTADTKDVAIFENKTAFDNYRLYPAKGLMVLGGVNAYDFLNLNRFNDYFRPGRYLRIAPIFIAQSKNLKALSDIKEVSHELILHNTDLIDLFFLMNQKHLIFISELENPGWNFFGGSYGILQPVPYQDHSLGNFVFGDLSFSNFSVFANRQDSTCNIPIKIDTVDDYLIVLRIYGAGEFSKLSIYFDEKYIGTLDCRQFRGFRWVQLGATQLKPGNYSLKLKADEAKPVLLDTLAIIATSEFDSGINDIYKNFQDIYITHIVNKQNILRQNTTAITDLYLGNSGQYDIILRLSSNLDKLIEGEMKLKIDAHDVASVNYSLPQNKPVNIHLSDIYIGKGRHTIAIENILQPIELQFIAIQEAKNNITDTQEFKVKIDYNYDSLSNYNGIISTSRPLILVHNETNYSGWKMKAGHKVIEPIVTNMFLNGFILGQTGEINFNIYYLNILQMIGIVISSSMLILAVFLIIYLRPKNWEQV